MTYPRHTRIVVLAVGSLMIGSVLHPATAQVQTSTAPAQTAPAPISALDMAALFKKKAGLGKDKEQLQEEIKPLLTQGERLKQEETQLKQDQQAFDTRYNAAAAVCNNQDWSKPALAHCYQDDRDLQAAQTTLIGRIDAHKQAANRLEAEASKVLARQQAVEEQIKKIDALLAAQKPFERANQKCADAGKSLEAAVQCMEVEWDRAGDPGYTVTDPPQMTRTPEQAIQDYIKSGGPTLIRPKGGGKEPPPPSSGPPPPAPPPSK